MSFLTDASLVYIPSGYKEDKAYSVKPTDGSGDLTFTRASDGTRVNSQGLVERVPWNLLPNSEVFALWNTVQIGTTITVTDNYITAPNGTLTAAKVVFATFDGTGQMFQNYTFSPTQNFTASLYAKVPSGTKQCWFGFFDGSIKTQLKTLTTEWQRIEYTGSITAGTIRACWFYGEGGASNVEVHLWGGQLNEGSTAKPYFPTTDRLNVPRLDYSNGCPSLLLEPQRTNLVTYSEQFDNAYWAKGGITSYANATTAPNGTTTADSLIENTANSFKYIGSGNTVSSVSGTTYTGSVYAKSSDRYLQITFNSSAYGSAQYANFDLINGTLGTYTGGTPTITSAGSGWYRCTFSATATATTSTENQIYYSIQNSASATRAAAYTGNGTSGIFIWGAQLEAGSYPTSYIPTTSASVTRVADAAYKTGISSLIGQTEGTLFGEAYFQPGQENLPIWARNSAGGVYGDSLLMYTSSAGTPAAQCTVGGVNQVNIVGSSTLSQGWHKYAFAYKANDFVLYVDGVQIGTDSSGSVPTCNEIYIDQYIDGGIRNTAKRQAVLFKTRLTNDQLEYLTGDSYSTYAQMATALNYTIQ